MTWVCQVTAADPAERYSYHDTKADADARAWSYTHRTPPGKAVVWWVDLDGEAAGWRDGAVVEVGPGVAERGLLGKGQAAVRASGKRVAG